MPADRPTSAAPVRPSAAGVRTALHTEPDISLGVALATWLMGWLFGNIAGTVVLSASGYAGDPAGDRPAWVAVASAIALWIPQIVALVYVGQKYASGRPHVDYGLRFRPIDLVGLAAGALSQLVLLPVVYWPLQSWWPDTFSKKDLEKNAQDLYDTAHGGWLVLLVVTLVVGAPLVEELVYRGLLMGAARRRFHDGFALVGVAAFFALIHFRPVEYPGLFAFGLVLGACVLVTNRIGMAVLAHLAFNATAIALVAR